MSTDVTKINTNANFAQPMSSPDEIDLREVFSELWRGKWLVLSSVLLFTTFAVAAALFMPNVYRSEALLAPVAEEQSGGLSALASQFGGLASLAGVNLRGKGAGSDKAQMAIEVLKSRQFASEFIQQHDILAELMAAKTWEKLEDKLVYDEDDYLVETKTWIRKVKPPFTPKPSMQEAFKKFTKIFAVETDKQTGMVTISVEHISPNIAQQWVTWLVHDINTVMKERDVAEANRSREFLNKQIALTNVADIKSVLYKLVEEQTKTIMFAEVRDEYVFKTVDPAIAPEFKVKPKRLLIVALGLFLGLCLGCMIVLVRYFSRKSS